MDIYVANKYYDIELRNASKGVLIQRKFEYDGTKIPKYLKLEIFIIEEI